MNEKLHRVACEKLAAALGNDALLDDPPGLMLGAASRTNRLEADVERLRKENRMLNEVVFDYACGRRH